MMPTPQPPNIYQVDPYRLDQIQYLMGLNNTTQTQFDKIFKEKVTAQPRGNPVKVPFHYREEPVSSDLMEDLKPVEVRQEFKEQNSLWRKDMDDMINRSHDFVYKNLHGTKHYQFGVFRQVTINPETQDHRSYSASVVRKEPPPVIQSTQQSSEKKSRFDFRQMNEERQQILGIVENPTKQSGLTGLPRDIAKISQLSDAGEDYEKVDYHDALNLLQIIEDIKNIEHRPDYNETQRIKLNRQKLQALMEDVIEDVSTQQNPNINQFREIAPISRKIVQATGQSNVPKHLQEIKERIVLLSKNEVSMMPENLVYNDLINIISGRLSPTSLRNLFPEGEKSTNKPQLQRILFNLASANPETRNRQIDQTIQTEQEEAESPRRKKTTISQSKEPSKETELKESDGSDESPKNLGKIRSLKKKIINEHNDQYDMMSRYEQICQELKNINYIKKNLVSKTTFEEGFRVRQDINQIILEYLEELHQQCLDSDEDMLELIGGFPQGLAQVGHRIDFLKGRKTSEGVSIGQVLRTILLEYKTIMLEFRQDDTIRHQLLEEQRIKEEKQQRRPLEKCHDYQLSKNHRMNQLTRHNEKKAQTDLTKTRKTTPNKTPSVPINSNLTTKRNTMANITQKPHIPQKPHITQKTSIPQKPNKNPIPQKPGFASSLQHVNKSQSWFGAPYNDSEFQ